MKASDTPPADPAAWSGLAGTDGDVSLQISALPLALCSASPRWGCRERHFEGALDVNVTGQWSGPANVKLQGTADANNFSLAAAALGSDVLKLDRVQATCRAARQGQQVTIDDTKLECDVGKLSAGGQVDVGERGITSLADLLSGHATAASKARSTWHGSPACCRTRCGSPLACRSRRAR